jgi:dUTP pyrophosphatase
MRHIQVSIVPEVHHDVWMEGTNEEVLCQLPAYAHEGDAAMDCYCFLPATRVLKPGECTMISLGFKVRVPQGFVLWLIPRSGLGKKQIIIPNSPGTVDSGYSDTVRVLLMNISGIDLVIEDQTRVCQMLVVEVPKIVFNVVYELPAIETTRIGGFGSSGVRSLQPDGAVQTWVNLNGGKV